MATLQAGAHACRSPERLHGRRERRRKPAVPAAPEEGAEEHAVSLFSFFRKKAAGQEKPEPAPAKEQTKPESEPKPAKDFNWFMRRLLLAAEAAGWNKGVAPDPELVALAGQTCVKIEKRICEVCREAGDASTGNVIQHLPRVCFLAGIVSAWHMARNRRVVEAAGLYWTITHEIGIEHAEQYALWLMGLTDGEGTATPKGLDLAAFARKQAEDATYDLAEVLVRRSDEEFSAAMAAAMEAMFIGGTLVGASLMPGARP